jgi:anti-sigma-K factor RskA
MTDPLNPEAIETLAAGYVVGDLDRSEVEAFEKLLAEDPGLRTEVQRLQATLDRVIYSLNSVEPPPHLQATILATATVSATAQSSPRKPIRVPWRIVIGSMAAILILGLGLDNYRLRQDFRMAQDINQDINTLLLQSQTQLFSLKAVNASEMATGSFVVNLGQRQGVLAIQNLAATPTGKVYRLWAIADGEKIPCGTLTLNSQGKVLNKFWMPADFYDLGISGLLITLESSETSRYPSGRIIMQSQPSTKI